MILPYHVLLTCAWLLGSLALPNSPKSSIVHEKRTVTPEGWIKGSRAHPHRTLPVRIGLAQRNLHLAEEYMLDIADPRSPNFGRHWTAEQVANAFAPSQEALKTVTQWLVDSGIDAKRLAFSQGRNWILFNATVSESESLFSTEYFYFRNELAKDYRIACDKYHLPEHLVTHVDFAMPTVHLAGMRPMPNLNKAVTPPVTGLTGLKNCYELMTIECLRELYQFGPGNMSAPSNKIGIPQFGDYLSPLDLAIYFANYTTQPVPNSTLPEFISIDGGLQWNNSLPIGGESALDIQTAYSIIYPQSVRLYQVGDVLADSSGSFNGLLDALDGSYCQYLGGDAPYLDPIYPNSAPGGYKGPLQCGGAPLSNVLSFSYLQIEAALPEAYQRRQCNEWMKLGLQGVSVLFASGDSGVANRYNTGFENSCLTSPDVGPYIDVNGTRFSPSFPANCPWVTTVGATFLKSHNISDGEVAVALPYAPNWKLDYYSGGGFSNVFEQPAYQSKAVSRYLSTYPPPYGSDIYNSHGRAYPDISAIGLNVSVVYRGGVLVAGGTSASTPIVASLITLLNEERIAIGKRPIGFLNPILYSHPEAFSDITEGKNPGCGSDGFQAQPGWDPVTGLGSPKYPKLKEIFLNLP